MKETFHQSAKLTLSVWASIVFLSNTFFAILANTTKVFPEVAWDLKSIIYFLGVTIVVTVVLFLAFTFTSLTKENKVLRERNEQLVLGQSQGFVRLGEKSFMVSEFDENTGKLEYEDKRCLLMSYDTLQGIFEIVKKNENGISLLKDLGYDVGFSFATSFRKYLKKEYPVIDLELDKQIDEWCAYDKKAGFGALSNKIIIDDNDKFSGEIHTCFSFLTEDRNLEQPNLCEFMEGYIEGVLNRIANTKNRNIHVEHVTCDLKNPGKPNLGCKFRVEHDALRAKK